MKKIIVWHKPRDDSYYYRIVNGTYANYSIGFKNSYDHEVVLIIDEVFNYQPPKKSLKKKLLTRLISFLQKINE